MKNLKNRIKGLSFNEVFQLVLKEKIEKGIDDSERKYLEDVLIGWNIYPSIDKKAYE